MKLISAPGYRLVSRPSRAHYTIVNADMEAKGKNPSQKAQLVGFQEVLRDIYFSEDLKIQFDRCKNILVTIDVLCVKENNDFCAMYKLIREEIQEKRKTVTVKQKLFQAAYLYQVERLPIVLQRLGTEEEGSMNDIILWQVSRLHCNFFISRQVTSLDRTWLG